MGQHRQAGKSHESPHGGKERRPSNTPLHHCSFSGLAILSAATLAPALRVDIPFPFVAGNATHNAGVYWVKIDLESQFVALRPVDSTVAGRVILYGNHVGRNGPSLTKVFLRFERYGSTYTLRAVGAAFRDRPRPKMNW
jgi:hypothetical protein